MPLLIPNFAVGIINCKNLHTMKKSCFKVSYALLLTLLVSCSKEPKWADYFNENYAGHYKLESATFAPEYIFPESGPIDFDGSGKKTNDIIDGLGLSFKRPGSNGCMDLGKKRSWFGER